jgi:hypothetical protein
MKTHWDRRSNYALSPDWDTDRKKEARHVSVISTYRTLTGNQSVPADKQYWTMCGAHYTGEGIRVIPGELGQVIGEGLIVPSQWRGVDREGVVTETNRRFYPDVWWRQGDFYGVMRHECCNGTFNPGLVNYDGIMGPKYGVPYLKGILRLIDANVNGSLVLVANFVLKSPYRSALSCEPKDVLMVWFRRECPIIADHWEIVPVLWGYRGGASSHSSARMGTFILKKSEHCGQPRYTAGRNLLLKA